MNPFVIIELAERIVLLAMEGQTPEQRAKMWGWWIEDVEKFREFIKGLKVPDQP